MIMRLTPDTFWSPSSSAISDSGIPARSGHRMTPLLELSVLWREQATLMLKNVLHLRRVSACCLRLTSIKRPPLPSFFTDLGVSISPFNCFSTINGLNVDSCLLSADSTTRNRGKELSVAGTFAFVFVVDLRFFG